MTWLDTLRLQIAQSAPEDAYTRSTQGVILIDIRTPGELRSGTPQGALAVPRDTLELQVAQLVPDTSTPIILICGSGTRSLLAADGLIRSGYTSVESLTGGFDAWKAKGLPVESPETLADPDRYARHLAMPDVGPAGQGALLQAKVLLVGAGGLGSPAALYLAAAGVGTIGIADHDTVDRSNLQRQVLHSEESIGWPKVASGAARLRALNSDIKVIPHQARLEAANARGLIEQYDLVIDGTDNFEARYVLSDTARRLGKPYIYAAVFQFEGQVSFFDIQGPCYRCFQPSPPPPEVAPSCAEAGVLGILPGIIGSLQALEAIKYILGIGSVAKGRLMHFDALAGRITQIEIPIDPACSHHGCD